MNTKTAEKKIVKKLIELCLAKNISITVDCEGDLITKSKNKKEIMDNAFAADQCFLIAFDESGTGIGWCFLVFGNDGYDVIADHSAYGELTNIIDSPEMSNFISDVEDAVLGI